MNNITELLSLEDSDIIINQYNKTIEDIYYLQKQLYKFLKENEQVWKAYEEVDMPLHG